MVWSDWAGFTRGRIPKFVKRYANIGDTLLEAAQTYVAEVASGEYPAPEHEYAK
jgi:3-methyl-2-oxobutanoate hydroxymethyltransferase